MLFKSDGSARRLFSRRCIEQREKGPQRKLLKLVDFDEEHAAAILRQWIREGATGMTGEFDSAISRTAAEPRRPAERGDAAQGRLGGARVALRRAGGLLDAGLSARCPSKPRRRSDAARLSAAASGLRIVPPARGAARAARRHRGAACRSLSPRRAGRTRRGARRSRDRARDGARRHPEARRRRTRRLPDERIRQACRGDRPAG